VLLLARLEGNAMKVSTERSASAADGPRGDSAVNRAAEPARNGPAPKRPPAGNGSDRVRPMLPFRWWYQLLSWPTCPGLRRGAVLRFPGAHRARACRIASMAVLTGKSGLDGEPLVPANGSPAG
jgi:hypothetical protein